VPLLPQTRRHALLAHLLRVPSIVFAVNKIDAVDDPAKAFAAATEAALQAFAAEAGIDGGRPSCRCRRCAATTSPQPLAAPLVPRAQPAAAAGTPAGHAGAQHRRAAAAGAVRGARRRPASRRRAPATSRVCCGAASPRAACKAGDAVQVFPSGERPWWPSCAAPAARWQGAGRAVAGLCSTGSSTSPAATGSPAPAACRPRAALPATLAWLDTEPATPAASTGCATATAGCRRAWRHRHRLDIHNLQPHRGHSWPSTRSGVVIELQQPLPVEPYASNRVGGALIVVDPASHRTSGALLVRSAGDLA
jgi:sulfate adenylyltransferase subunit 1